MSSTAQIQQQINSVEQARRVLENVLAQRPPGSADAKILQTEIARLNTQLVSLQSQQAAANTASNPPNPQVNNPAAPPPPPALTTVPASTGNPPNPQVSAIPSGAETGIDGVITVTPATVTDDAASTGTGSNRPTDITFIDTDLDSTAEPVNSTTVFLPDGREIELAAGQTVDEFGAIGGEGELRRFATDVDIEDQTINEADGIIEFTAGGQRVVDADNPDFVVTPGGFRVLAEDQENPYPSSDSDLIREPTDADVAEAAQAQSLLAQARNQAEVSALRKANGKAVGDGDWRVRLRLAPYATYLYKNPDGAGIMEPLRNTDGVVFPYTPRIDMSYIANYNPQELTHANYTGYFYKGSKVGEVLMTADFTAQDSNEADYLLATIHFFRSCTKMFYGQDDDRGSPPPLVFLSGLGEFQFNEHPCVISQFNYNLPPDVDYIRARGRQSTSAGITQGGNGLMFRRTQTGSPTSSYSLSNIWSRLTGANLPKGAVNYPPAPPNLGLNSPTYVPTKMSISLTLLPMPTRSQVSQQFSLDRYANGNLLKGGFW